MAPEADWLIIWDDLPVGALPLTALWWLLSAPIYQLTQPAGQLTATHESDFGKAVDADAKAASTVELMRLLQTDLGTLLNRPELRDQLVPLRLVPAVWSVQDIKAYLCQCDDDVDGLKWVAVGADRRPLGLLKPSWIARLRSELPVSRELAAQHAASLQVSQLKSDYLAYISHEVKNPITALLGLSELLADSTPIGLSDRQQHYIQLIRDNSRHLAAIANNILDLSRIELNQLQLSHQAMSIRQICDRAWQLSAQGPNGSPEALAGLNIYIQAGLTEVTADEQRLVQMLIRLFANARTSVASSGSPSAASGTAGSIGVTVEEWGQWYAITVWDRGAGIPAEQQPLLLQTLKPAPRNQTPEETGFGLVLTQRLAQLHGGDLTFVSTAGKSEFTLLLPSSPHQTQAASATSRSQPVAPRASRQLAMIVDTEVERIMALLEQLKSNGYCAAVARSGTEALQKVRQLHPQIVLLNPAVPLLSGWDVLALIKHDQATQHIPVIMTASATAPILDKGVADALLTTPSTAVDLMQAIASVTPQGLQAVPQQKPLPQDSPSKAALTVLYLNATTDTATSAAARTDHIDFSSLLHPYGCRVLEVDDFEQGNIIARVWKPSVALLGLSVPADVTYLQQLRQLPSLAKLPMVVINPDTAAAGHRAGLLVYPCLMSPQTLQTGASVDLALLVQVIHTAVAGARLA